MTPFSGVTVVGLGAMGGSLARALSVSGRSVTGWSPRAVERHHALDAGAVSRAPDALANALDGAELVVLAVPLEATCDLMGIVGTRTGSDTTLTDVASLKVPVWEAARREGVANRWVGCHPMAGTEGSGFEASRADLYEDARIWLVADPEASPAGERVHQLWRDLGARPAFTEAEEHDRLMAWVSHLPQLASNALARVLSDAGVAGTSLGPGGHTATRLAGSSPAVWRDILAYARPELGEALRALAAEMETIADLVDERDVQAIEERMRHTRAWRHEA